MKQSWTLFFNITAALLAQSGCSPKSTAGQTLNATQGQQSPVATPKGTESGSGYKLIAERATVLIAASSQPGPYSRVDESARCAVAPGTMLTLKEAPKAESEESAYALIELLAAVPATDPSKAGLGSASFANEVIACPHLHVWLSLGAYAPAEPPSSSGAEESGGGINSGNSSSSGCCNYPLKARAPTCEEAGGGAGAFGSGRGGGRLHGGCDLYGRVGQAVVAIDDGVVVTSPYLFYCDTDALEVRHGLRIVRYGEIRAGSARLSQGQNVRKGEKIAEIGKLSCYYQPMVHFEIYGGSSSGPLSTMSGPYRRRSDLQDPTRNLKEWRGSLP